MGFTTKSDFTFKHTEKADEPVYNSPAELKADLDSQAIELKDYINDTLTIEVEDLVETAKNEKKLYKVAGFDATTAVSSPSDETLDLEIPLGITADHCFYTITGIISGGGTINALKLASEGTTGDSGYKFNIESGAFNTNSDKWVLSRVFIDGDNLVVRWARSGDPSTMVIKIAWDIRAYG